VEEAVSTAGPTLCRTPSRATPPPQIPDALRALWRSCTTDVDDANVARSLAINFVGVASVAEEADLRAAVDRLQRRTPCRAFLLLLDDATRAVTAEVSATTRRSGGTHDIVLEEITIRMPTAALEQMPGLVRPLLVNDLPNHLFWGTAWPRSERHFDDLAALCEHVVVDTRRFASPAVEIDHVDARKQDGLRITDLCWLRLRPWRRALAEAFERFEFAPGNATSVQIEHGDRALAAAMRLGQWLETRLGAKVTLDGSGAADRACPDRVLLRCSDNEIDLQAPANHIAVHVTTAAHCCLPFKVPTSRGTDGDLLAAAIDIA
jgi:glucose-6-phosphate dehydrogenase assembly protein OpcA